jgi:thiol-disulfide isomerase/thioredoxin
MYVAIAVLAFSSWSVYALQHTPVGPAPARVQKLAPLLKAQTRSGKQLDLRSLRGKWVLVNFWATWCPPCRREMASLEKLATLMKGKPFVLLAVSVDKDWKTIDNYLRQNKGLGKAPQQLNMQVVRDPGAKASLYYGTSKYPETYWIDPHGKIRAKIIGEKKWASPKVLQWIRRWMISVKP